jgi:hypothetical protein
MSDLRPRDLVTMGAVVAAGLAGSAVALGSRGGDAQFLQEQRHPPSLRPAEVERVVRSAPDPKSGTGHGVAATCKPKGAGPLRNPWSCVVRFQSGKRVRLNVQIQNDGTYDGRYVGVAGAAASGCCINLPGIE